MDGAKAYGGCHVREQPQFGRYAVAVRPPYMIMQDADMVVHVIKKGLRCIHVGPDVYCKFQHIHSAKYCCRT
jgi:hypothetical protein